MKQASRCVWRPATALIVALTEHRGRLDRACRPPVDAWLCESEMNPGSSPLQPGQSSAGAGDEACVCDEMWPCRCWLSNLRCNPSLCRCINHFALPHNEQNRAATAIYPLISWSDSNLGSLLLVQATG
ncbi:hypothetical protein ACQJBY_026096 [Aegilops geniculata]